MKRMLLLLLAATVMVLVLAPTVRAQVWSPGEAPPALPEPAQAPPTPDTPKAKQDDRQTVEIQDFEFSPAQLTVDTGTTVTWVNQGDAPHTVTADDGLFDSGTLQPGRSFSHTFQSPGTVSYHCEIHREMTASVTVGGGGATAPGGKAAENKPPKVEQQTPVKQTSSGGIWLTAALIIGVLLIVAAAVGWVVTRRAS